MPEPVPLTEELMQALLVQSSELLAVSDAAGRLLWTNRCFDLKLGHRRGDEVRLADFAAAGPPGNAARRLLAGADESAEVDAEPIMLRGRDDAHLYVEAKSCRLADRWLWTLSDRSAEHFLADQARRQGEMARRGAGVRPHRPLGARHRVGRRPLGPLRLRLLGDRSGHGYTEPRTRRRLHSSRRPQANQIPRIDAARRPIRSALPRLAC